MYACHLGLPCNAGKKETKRQSDILVPVYIRSVHCTASLDMLLLGSAYEDIMTAVHVTAASVVLVNSSGKHSIDYHARMDVVQWPRWLLQ
jgi:hypothetical protein